MGEKINVLKLSPYVAWDDSQEVSMMTVEEKENIQYIPCRSIFRKTEYYV